jgi:calcium permeable stress-gated cation channel
MRKLCVLLFHPRVLILLSSYMFLRFLKMLIWIFLAFTIVTWLILIPVDAAGVKSAFDSLDKLTWSKYVHPFLPTNSHSADLMQYIWPRLTETILGAYHRRVHTHMYNFFSLCTVRRLKMRNSPVFIIFMIRREMHHFVQMRHKFLDSKSHSRLPQARTVLITSVPKELANEKDLRDFASFVPGGVDRIWIYRDTKVGRFAMTWHLHLMT